MSHIPTDETRKVVQNATGMGFNHEDICQLLGIKDPKTLRRRYRKELNAGLPMAKLQVATTLFKKACDGNMTAIIWWEKTRAGRSDRLMLTTPPGEPFATTEIPATPDNIGKYHERLAQIEADRAARRSAPAVARARVQEDLDDQGHSED
jgi:hypothetical protein